jgi:ribonuclease BN (tRNA processing enzyme)
LIPTVGILVEDASGAILYTSDTGPTERVWQVASSHQRLKCVITEISFASDDDALARASGHMTPRILAAELRKLTGKVPVLVTHTKPGHLARIERELAAMGLVGVELIQQGRTYEF